ncbi:MAG: tRNA lysidine(34) synthetase TilS [Rhodothermales bacterium]
MLPLRVQDFIEQEALIEREGRVLVGVSGGVDSVVLLDVLRQLHYVPLVAHVNYRLRGPASDDDETFVRELCQSLNLSYFPATFDTETYAAEHGQSIQEAARTLRYGFFARLAEEEGVPCVAVAHHVDDQAETVLLNLLRGAGPEGIAGMAPKRPMMPGIGVSLVRPLLTTRRVEIEAYAREAGLVWREDASNQSLKYKRGVLRREIIPLIEHHFGQAASANIARSSGLLRAYLDESFHAQLEVHFTRVAERLPAGGKLRAEGFGSLAPVWQGRLLLEALKRWLPEAPRRASLIEEIKTLFKGQAGRKIVLKTGTIWRERDGLLFVGSQAAPSERPEQRLMQPGETIDIGDGMLRVELLRSRPERLDVGAPTTVVVDADALEFPLRIRRWQSGDRFQPMGMEGTKKVSDFLTDQKVPSHRRARTHVLLSGDDIIWIVGYRLAQRACVQPGTQHFAKITYIPRS